MPDMMYRHAHVESGMDPALNPRHRSTFEVVKRVTAFLRPYRWMALGNIGCAVLSLVCAFTYPKLARFIIDDVISQKRADWLAPAAAVLALAFFLREFFNSLRIRINNEFEQRVIFDMRSAVYARLQRLPVSYFDPRASGDLMTRVIEDVGAVERVLIDGTEQGTVAALSILGVLVVMLVANPALTGVALLPVPLLIAGALAYTLTASRRYRAQRQAASAMNALLLDNLQGIRQIKGFGREEHEDKRFRQRADDLRRANLRIMRAWSLYSPGMSFCAALGIVLVLWWGGRQVMHGSMTVGQLVEFVFYLGLLYEPVGRLHGLNQMLQSARAAGERVFDILDTPPERSEGRTRHLPRVRGHVRYEHVYFRYGNDRTILKDICLEARPGEMIALVGPTGAGKSTLVNLLPAFYEPSEGRITVDGEDISTVSLASLRQNIGIVSQEPFLFNGTIRENILYGKPDATNDELLHAARAANCHEFIERLPQKYDSLVGERGVKLSVGEKQRISIARALLKNAPILILDEATASVDTATEKLIQEALARLLEGRTSFVIAHRLSTIIHASQILVLRNGEIVERGRHEQLLELNGLYARLARIQNTASIEEGFARLIL